MRRTQIRLQLFGGFRTLTHKPKKREKRYRRKIKISRNTDLYIQPFSEDPEQ